MSHEKLDFVQPYITAAALQPRHILEQEFILLSEYLKCQHLKNIKKNLKKTNKKFLANFQPAITLKLYKTL